MRSAVTTLLSFVALPAVPLRPALDTLIELVDEIVGLSRKSGRHEFIDFGEYVNKFVNQLVHALGNEQITKDINIMNNLEELRRTLERILCTMHRNDSLNGVMFRLRRALFPEEDQIQVARMRQQLDDARELFKFAADCELLARTQRLNPTVDSSKKAKQPAFRPSDAQAPDPFVSQERPVPNAPEPSRTRCSAPSKHKSQASRRKPFLEVKTSSHVSKLSDSDNAELIAVDMEVIHLRRLFQRSRRPIPAMDLAIALSRYSELLVNSGHINEALSASQESADLFKSLAEKGPKIYYNDYET
ncbi:unnamed protein product [Rhizoctonia solani]|uniref:Uncharacterized protein n=1 Tax=Rhizoctonia solani TaxID=456999 RepID=A0A8H3BEW5_9AGAM|nr:unnamed protein product [Rhizoctonia solani]